MAKFWGNGKFPYTNLNNLNLDWMIKLVLELKTRVEELVIEVGEAYIKPDTGIPKTDLSQSVQDSLDLADSALQSVPDTYRTATEQDVIDSEQDDRIDPMYESAHYIGGQVTFNALATSFLKNLIINIEATQNGSGTVSPSNIRDIIGTDVIQIFHRIGNANHDKSISLPKTAYGATLRYNGNGTWTLTDLFERAVINASDIDLVTMINDSAARVRLKSAKYAVARQYPVNIICNYYPNMASSYANLTETDMCLGLNYATGTQILINDSSIDLSSHAFLDRLTANPLQFTYPLPEEKSYTFTSADIIALIGENMIWTDASSFNFDYGAFVETLTNSVENRITLSMFGNTENGYTATREYSVNDFVIIENRLFKITQPVQVSGTLSIDVNMEETTISTVLTALLNGA